MQNDETYNGYKNYPTWDVALWIDNERAHYETARALAIFHLAAARSDDNVTEGIWTTEQAARFRLADSLKDWVRNDLAPDLEASFAADLLGYALDQVDWHELAGNWISEIDEAHATA